MYGMDSGAGYYGEGGYGEEEEEGYEDYGEEYGEEYGEGYGSGYGMGMGMGMMPGTVTRGPKAEYRRILQSQVRFERADTRLEIPTAALDWPLRTENPEVARSLSDQSQRALAALDQGIWRPGSGRI